MEGYYFPRAVMAVCAVSGGVVLVAFQAHKRLLSGFLEKFESELCGYDKDLVKKKKKKKVRFAKDVMEPSGNNKEYRRKRVVSKMNGDDDDDHGDEESTVDDHGMPKNRVALYKGILDYKVQVKGRNQYHVVVK